jgi:hypothetical protein
MPAVNDVGEPCAGKPHARFDGRELETEQALVKDTEKNATVRNHPATAAPRPTTRKCHRASSRPYTERAADLEIVDLIFVGLFRLGGRDEVAGVLFCR